MTDLKEDIIQEELIKESIDKICLAMIREIIENSPQKIEKYKIINIAIHAAVKTMQGIAIIVLSKQANKNNEDDQDDPYDEDGAYDLLEQMRKQFLSVFDKHKDLTVEFICYGNKRDKDDLND